MTLKVFFYDEIDSDFQVEYATASGIVIAGNVESGGTGAVRTATFELPGMVANGSFTSGMDFQLIANGSDDAVIRFVRLIDGTL